MLLHHAQALEMTDLVPAQGDRNYVALSSSASTSGAREMEALRSASDEAFDTLSLQFMYLHHEGTVAMVEGQTSADGAQDTFIFQLAKEIDGDQRIEMDRIIGMLADVGETPLPAAG